jgi:hypothetical protein
MPTFRVAAQVLQYPDLTDIRAQRKQPTPTGVAHAETLGLRGASQIYKNAIGITPAVNR